MKAPSSPPIESAFSDLLVALLPGQQDFAVLIQSYFDESYDDQTMCMAGYVFRSGNARKFNVEWRRMLWRNGRLPYFHMTDCNVGEGVFKHLSKAQCIIAQTEAIGLINRYAAYGSAVTVDQAAFYRVVTDKGFVRSPYEFSAWSILTSVQAWANRTGGVGRASYFFEAGHQHKAQANALMGSIFKAPELREYYRYMSHSFVDKADGRPLQAADILAWQWMKDLKRRRNGHTKSRADLAALIAGTPHHVMHVDEERLRAMMQQMNARAGGPWGNEMAAVAIRNPSELASWKPPD